MAHSLSFSHRSHWGGVQVLLVSLCVCAQVLCCLSSVDAAEERGVTESSKAADDSARIAARALGNEGVTAYQNEEYAQASQLLEDAYDVLKVPSLALWSARALVKIGRWVEASERYLEASRLLADSGGSIEVQQKAQEEAALEHEELSAQIPVIVLILEGAPREEVDCSINGKTVNAAFFDKSRPTDPGEQRVLARYGEIEIVKELTLSAGERREIILQFSASAPVPVLVPVPVPIPAPVDPTPIPEREASKQTTPVDTGEQRRWMRPTGWAALGAGAAGLAVGGTLALVASAKKGGLDCDGSNCNAEQDDIDRYNDLLLPSAVAIIAGGVLAGAGLTLLLTAPKARGKPVVSSYFGLGHAGVRGRF